MQWNNHIGRLLVSALTCTVIGVGSVYAEARLTARQQNEACYGAEIDYVIEDADGRAVFAYELPVSIMPWAVTTASYKNIPERAPKVSVPPCFGEPIVYGDVQHPIALPKDIFDIDLPPSRPGNVSRDGLLVNLVIQAGGINISGGGHLLTTGMRPRSGVDWWRTEIATWAEQGDLGEISPEFLGFFHDKEKHPNSFSPAMVASGAFFEPVTGRPMLYSCLPDIGFILASHVRCETAYQLVGDVFIKYEVRSGQLPFSQWQLLDIAVRDAVLSRIRPLK
jgi:hypothetical protein